MAPRDYSLHTYVLEEMRQRQEEGHDVGPLIPRYARLAIEGTDNSGWLAFYRELAALPQSASFPYDEPAGLDAIRARRPRGPRRLSQALSPDELERRILGAWLGRCVGCTLGKPVEGWYRPRIRRYLELASAYPLTTYFPILDPFPEGLELRDNYTQTGLGRVQFMARDDDTDYTLLGLHIVEQHGLDFATEDVGQEWLNHMPYQQVYTAERMAYRNLVNELQPPQTALVLNPYREWIGAQIRADIYGYVCPGWPERAAELAYRDATLSHIKNGVYGAMLVASLLSAALVLADVTEVVQTALAEIPAQSRLAELVREVMVWYSEDGDDWEWARDRLEQKYGLLDRVHTINNTGVVLLALLYGKGDFAKTIALAVMGGWDTDCNGATAGSIAGALLGADRLPAEWVGPLNDTLHTAVVGFGEARISELAHRTAAVAGGGES